MQSVADFFHLKDPAELGWAHAVNGTRLLEDVCADAAVQVVEGDVQYACDDALPCMAAAYQDIADMDVETWLDALMEAGKAAKLDFGSAEAVEPTLAVLQRLKPEIPIILHANIFALLAGEGRDDTMEPEQFIRLCQEYCPDAVLSLGWSLKREYDADGRMEDMLIQQMADLSMKRLGPTSYAVEIRAGYTPGWERGAALIFDPIPAPLPALAPGLEAPAANVVDARHLFGRAA